jgi:hypothetical protein
MFAGVANTRAQCPRDTLHRGGRGRACSCTEELRSIGQQGDLRGVPLGTNTRTNSHGFHTLFLGLDLRFQLKMDKQHKCTKMQVRLRNVH